jgi:trimeric autotransporter adhesin
MTHPRISRPAAVAGALSLAGLCGVFAGCSTRTDVSAIGNTPALYSHVYVTAQAVWFNNSATAGPDDGGWVKFALSTPATVDLVADSDSNGTFGNLVTGLRLAPGTYSQIRLIPVDATMALTSSAQALGAVYNMEADYVNASGVTVQAPLQILNPDKGIGIQTSLTVPIGNIGAGLSAVASSANTSTTTPDTGFASTETTTPTTTGTGTGLGLGSSSSTTTTIANFTFSFDGARDLVMFAYGGNTGVLYSSHGSAYDLSQAGGITGQLTLTNLTGITGPTGLPDIYVNAELVTPDNSRHYVVASAPVNSDGSFTLYPLAINSSTNSPDTYDIVIHGPGIATIIIKDIQVFMTSSLESLSSSSSSSLSSLEDETSSLGSTTNSTTSGTTGLSGGLFGSTSATSTTTSTGANVITPQNLVSIGTLIPRQATSYTANITTSASAPLPAGAEVAFYQTLPGSNELPYVIERSAIDPINQDLATPQQLSTGTVDSGTFNNENTTDSIEGTDTTDTIDTTSTTSTTSTNTSGTLVTVVSASPKEGTGGYQVAADAPFYAYGALGTKVSMPASAASASVTTPVQEVSVGALSLASGNDPVTVNVEVNEASPGKYNAGEVLIGTNGQLVAAASLTQALQGGGGTVVLDKVPGGTATSVYYVTVVAWNSANPQASFTRQWAETPLNLASSGSASLQLTLE